MKKNVIALAIASAIAAPVAMADAPTVYGQVNMALEQVDVKDNDAASGTEVNSRASRVGVKGSEDLGNGLKAIYKFEFEVQIDEGSTLKNRNQYVGLAGGFGTVLMGRHDTPTKMIQAKDLFNDASLADNKPMAGGLGAFGKGMENRVSNVLAYVSPEFSGVKLIAAAVPSEGTTTGDESSLSDLYSVALTYGSTKKGLYLAAGMDQASEEYAADANHMRLVAQYKTGGLVANAMYQDFGGDAIEDTVQGGSNVQANLGYKMGNIMPKVKFSSVDRDAGEDSSNYAVGLNYSFGKKTTGYVEYASIENAGGVDEANTSAVSVGLLHKF
ncbi:MAG: porin [Thiomicrorhabdus chilensis]|uniref:porin n=1 Tax=Thiomicrorhabdus chilensis TaxID=63656 RepID=UPI00299DB767|nr:porin [Thiomicrorhabdus chilensis]MDX1347178.1 porin [Thiomicrorhabdus chilensis]